MRSTQPTTHSGRERLSASVGAAGCAIASQAIIDDYRVARELLLGTFRAAEAESLPAAIRELASNVGRKEKITRSRLAERVKRPRSTLYYQVDKAIHVYHILYEEKHGSRRLLTRNRDVPVPENPPVLPSVEEVEGLFFGVPAPIADDWFYRFLDAFED